MGKKPITREMQNKEMMHNKEMMKKGNKKVPVKKKK